MYAIRSYYVLDITARKRAEQRLFQEIERAQVTLEAMHVDMFVVRHAESGAAHFIANHVAPHVSVINAGDGRHAHPTQALLDMFTSYNFV